MMSWLPIFPGVNARSDSPSAGHPSGAQRPFAPNLVSSDQTRLCAQTLAPRRGAPPKANQTGHSRPGKRIWVGFFFILLFFFVTLISTAKAQPATHTPRKFALLIAVTELKNTPSRSLKGPANDVAHLRDLLVDRFAFAPSDILTVEKQAATKAGLIRAIETQLIEKAQPGDLCLLYYSGHGTQVPDQPPLDEADGLDEALVPYDANITHGIRLDTHKPCDGRNCEGDKCDGGDPIPSTLLIDDAINGLLSRIKTNNVVVLLDACHSGTATRGGATDKRWIRAKAIDAPGKAGTVKISDDLGGDLVEPTVLTAAASNQTAKDWPFLAELRASGGQKSASSSGANDNMGAFTYYLLEALQSGPSATYRQVMTHITARLNAREFTQTPQLEGRGLDRGFLSVAATSPKPPVNEGMFGPFRIPGATQARIVSAVGKTVRLHAMAGRPLIPGSIFSEGTLRVQVNTTTPTGDLEYLGTSLSGKTAAPGQILKESFRPISNAPLRIAVTGTAGLITPLETALKATLDRERFLLVPVTKTRDCDLDVAQTGGQISVTPYRNQQPLSVITGGSTAALVPSLSALLDNLSATTLLSRLENPSAEFAVDVRVNGKESDEVAIDDTVTFTARASRDCYLYLVDIDPAGKISVLFPNRYAPSNKLTANKVYNMPLPDVYRLRIQGPAGPEVVKAIATTTPLRLGVFADDRGEFAPLTGKASDTARAILAQLRQGINATSLTLPAGAKTADLMSVSGWTTATAYLRVLPKKN
jgi:hypothetical protein